ncbi:helix-turn-helix domain-containing protein [Chitinophaga sancti]|uniref:winged helix-turn-helix transcriptional regulator n=1 Tax=Chitinophaga sancti TaxID=1004 RepID=UPI002A74E15C|nr:helix-turn-helix domain-containing protein [Chitinophaga sancti]WPQ63508.1 helix-turn-helix domain-containing protein [Chitinophaga sancti]
MKGCPIQAMFSSNKDCNQQLGVAHDILDVLNGKWRMEVILQLLQHEKRRFKDLQTAIPGGVSAKVLSTVLKDLEEHQIVKRGLDDVTVEYELTEYGRSMRGVITNLVELGLAHRKEVIGK